LLADIYNVLIVLVCYRTGKGEIMSAVWNALLLTFVFALPWAGLNFSQVYAAGPTDIDQAYKLLCINPRPVLFPWTMSMYNATRAELSRLTNGRVEIVVENVRLSDLRNQERISALQAKYSGSVDFILVWNHIEAAPLVAQMFPDKPTLTSSYAARIPDKEKSFPQNLYVIHSPLSYERTGEAILSLLPDLKKIVIVAGSGPYGSKVVSVAQHGMGSSLNGVEVLYWQGISSEKLIEQSKEMVGIGAFLYLIQRKDKFGGHYVARDFAMKLSADSAIPVFGIADTYFGDDGIVGGYVDSSDVVGQRFARLMLSILQKKVVENTIHVNDYGVYQFDWRQLERWGISASSLPSGSVVLFQPTSLLAQYPIFESIGIGLGSALIISFISFALYLHRRSKLLKKNSDSLERYTNLFESSHLSLWEEDMSGLLPIFEELKNKGVVDWYTHFSKNKADIERCANAIKVSRINQATVALHQAESKEELMNRIADTFTRRSWDAFAYEVAALARGEGHMQLEGAVRTLKGNVLEVLVYLDVMKGCEDSLERVIITLIDTTEKKNLEAKLIQAQKLEAIGQLTSGVAHEVNTPLQYISGNLNFISKAIPELGVDENQELVEELKGAVADSLVGVENITNIVTAMKRLSHRTDDSIQGVNINELVRAAAMVSKNEWKFNAEFEYHLDDKIPFVECHPGEISQVILNLIVNSSHAIDVRHQGKEKGVIIASTFLDGDDIVIEIIDNGEGMSKDVTSRMFDPFYTTKEVGKGTGQGLAIALNIIRKHGGTITVDSTEGRGTKISVKLPLRKNTEAQEGQSCLIKYG